MKIKKYKYSRKQIIEWVGWNILGWNVDKLFSMLKAVKGEKK